MHIIRSICLFLIITVSAAAQEQDLSRGSIPEELLRPARGESPRYPSDVVIGELGYGTASPAAFSFASTLGSAFLSGRMDHNDLSSINAVVREGYLSELDNIKPESYRLGGGREEPDGAVSFLIRFIGKEQGITGELFIRYVTRQIVNEIEVEEEDYDDEDNENEDEKEVRVKEVKTTTTTVGSWKFDDLLLEEARNRDVELQEASGSRYGFSPYERFY